MLGMEGRVGREREGESGEIFLDREKILYVFAEQILR